MDILTIPTDEAIAALDLAASFTMQEEESEIALNNTSDYNRLHAFFSMNMIDGPFSRMILSLSAREGRRQMFMRQPLHLRYMSTQNPSQSKSIIPPTNGE